MRLYLIIFLLVVYFIVVRGYNKEEIYSHQKEKYVEVEEIKFNEPEMIFPNHGTVFYHKNKPSSSSNSELRIKTKSSIGNVFLKLKDAFNNEVVSLYIHGGKTVNIDIPLGTYYLSYASGNKWYGSEFLFGPNTIYSKSNDSFLFSRNMFWEVELFLQANGNMQITKIKPEDF